VSGGPSRRELIRAVAALALLPGLTKRAMASAGASARPIAPPRQPMLFTRRLSRELSGGYSIVAERSFKVGFIATGGGYRIDGEQVASTVDAPPNLAAYAKIEEERVETGLFPLDLDPSGLIRSVATETSHASLDRAVELALEHVRAMQLSQADKDEARAFLLGLQQAASQISSDPPADLFTPPAVAEAVSREVALPGGLTGSISASFSGSISPETGLLDEAERIVLTGAAGSTRKTLEHWSLRKFESG
jgi:hypothetical protein